MDNIIRFFERQQDKIEQFFKEIIYGIENLIIWLPVIWKDRNWDHWFLYKVLQHKLKQMIKLQRKWGNSINADDYADQMQVCVNLLDRLLKDEYLENALKPHEEKWGNSEMIFKPYNDDSCEFAGLSVEKAVTEKDKDIEKKERMRLYKHSDQMAEQDLDMLFQNMRKYITGWWD